MAAPEDFDRRDERRDARNRGSTGAWPRWSGDADRDWLRAEGSDHVARWLMAQRIPPEAAAQVARLFIEESPAVFRSALRAARGNRSEVDDLVQEAFQAAVLSWESIGGLSADRKRARLCRVAINKAIDGYRAGKLVQPTANLDAAGEMPSTEHA